MGAPEQILLIRAPETRINEYVAPGHPVICGGPEENRCLGQMPGVKDFGSKIFEKKLTKK